MTKRELPFFRRSVYGRRRVAQFAALLAGILGAISPVAAQYRRDFSGVELGEIGAKHAARIDSARFVNSWRWLSGHTSLEIGMDGNEAATRYIAAAFDSIGLQHIARQKVSVADARQEFAFAVLPQEDGTQDTIQLRCYAPNFTHTNTIPPGGLKGHVVYSRTGEAREFNGRKMEGSVLLAEMTVEERWRLASTLGSRAAIFIEAPKGAIAAQFYTSVNFPRFWVNRQDGDSLRAWAESHPDAELVIHARQPWQTVSGYNVTGFMEGADPVLAREVVIITAPFDAGSYVSGLAPGAEASFSSAAQLELARVFAKERPSRSLYFAALNGQRSGVMAGGRVFVQALKQSYPGVLRQNLEKLRADFRLISDRKLSGRLPAYRQRALALERRLGGLIDNELSAAEKHWNDLQSARADYLQGGAVTDKRTGGALYHGRRVRVEAMESAARAFTPAYVRALDACEPLIADYGKLLEDFTAELQGDWEALKPIVDADEGKIRTSVAGRLAAARMTDIAKALQKFRRMSPNDHTERLVRLRDDLALIEPILGRYPALLIDLSLTSNSQNIGLFHKGYFYNQVPDLELQRGYGPLGKRFMGYATNLVVVNDLTGLWSRSDEDIRALIMAKIAEISANAAKYRQVQGIALSDTEVNYSYDWYQRFANSTAWALGLLLAAICGWFAWRRRRADETALLPAWWQIAGIVLGLGLTGYAVIAGMDWKNTEKIHHGIDQLIWNHTDLLINAEQIPREEKTKIRLAAERHKRYVEMVEAPEFFADNIINAVPATLAKLRQDSLIIAQQLVMFQKIAPWRPIPPAALTQGQLDTLNQFIGFLGLQGDRRFVDGVAGTPGKAWWNFLPAARYFTSEISGLAGIPSIALSTTGDIAPELFGLRDTFDRVNVQNGLVQLKTLTAITGQALRDALLPDDIVLGDYLASASGLVLYDDRQSSVTADQPVDSAIVIADRGGYRFTTIANRRGAFEFTGLPLDGRSGARSADAQWLHAYKTSRDSGNVRFAIDLGSKQYAFTPSVSQLDQDWTVVVFPCASISVTDILDPRYFQFLARGDIYEARTDSKPWHFFSHVAMGDNTFFVEEGTKVKIIFAQGLLGVRMMLTGTPDSIMIPEHRQGIGFEVKREALLTHTAYNAARDMWQLNDGRLVTLIRHGIIDEETRAVHDSSAKRLALAKKALEDRRYDEYLTEARTALALESRVLPDVLGIANGALKGVLFYMALLLPFAFFVERLIVGSTDVKKQAIWFFVIFILMFLLIQQVHPAFDITLAPPMVLLAFTVFALSVFVVSIIIGKFAAQMKQIRKEQQGYLSADVGRVSAMFAAFLLGVSNMRKRKVRTTLTCLTLVLLTFTVLSFTSVQELLRVNKISLSRQKPTYSGVLIRDRFWNFWPRETLTSIRNEFGANSTVVGRGWREALIQGATSNLFTLSAANGKSYTLSGFVGMEPAEDEVTGIFRKTGVAGRWFRPGDFRVLVIPQTAADALGITREQVTGDEETAPSISMDGVRYAVIGILDDELLRQVKDIDGEELTSVNWSLVETKRQDRISQVVQAQKAPTAGERDSFIHLVPAQCMFMPLNLLPGGLVSVAIKTADYDGALGLVNRVIPKWALEMYVGQKEGTFLYSAIGLTTLGGMKDVIIPILIAALIVLNTMLGAVYERTREIGIFSSVGLAPSHIAMLFMAEAVVYAVLGAIAGYLLGQTVGQLIYRTGLLGGVTLNYSSLSAISSTLIVMATVILSTVYPAKKASEISVPDIARTWRLPEPNGDEWYFALPFTLMDEELEGVNAFLAHFFESHRDESASDFYIDRVEFWADSGRFMLETMVWLAPYDLGVSELVTMISSPVPNEDRLFGMSLLVTRESGDVPSWNRVNRRFVNFLRKQFLIWRTLTPEERELFKKRGRDMFDVDGERAIDQKAI